MRKHLFSVFCLLSLSVFIYSTWFFGAKLLSWGDFHAGFVETVKEFATFPTIWQGGNMFGSLLVTLSFWPQLFIAGLLSHLNLSSAILERIVYFWPIPLLNVVSMYFLSYYIFKSRIAGFTSAIVYGFSAGTLTLVVGGIVTEGIAISLLPLLVLSLMILLEKKNILSVLITGLLASIIGFYEFRILFLSSWILFFYVIHYLIMETKITKKIFAKTLLLMVGLGIVVLLLNAYWLIGIQSVHAISSNSVFATSLWGQEFTNIATSITIFPYFWTGGKPAIFTLEPILIYFWAIPIFAFLGLLYVGKNKKVLFFGFIALLGVFLAKQGGDPFPQVYQWLFDHFPGFNAFRYGTVFGVYTQLAYSILIAAFVLLVFDYSKNFLIRKMACYVLFASIIGLFLWNTKPLITKEFGELSAGVDIPQEYLTLKNDLVEDMMFYRTLSVPYAQRFTFYNNLHPQIGLNYLPEGQQSLNQKLLGLESVRYIILPSDPAGEIYGNGSKLLLENFINFSLKNSTGPLLSKNLGDIKLWENTNFNPHIMPVNDLVYVTGDVQMKDIVDLPTLDRVAYYPEDSQSSGTNVFTKNQAMLNNSTKIYSVASCIRCDITKQYYNYLTFPYAKFLPDSPLYSYVQGKEEKDIAAANSSEEKVGKEALYSEKRIVEIIEMIKNRVDKQYFIMTISNYNKLLTDMESYFDGIGYSLDNNNALLGIYDYLMLEKRQIRDMGPNPVDSLLQNMVYRQNVDIEKLSHIIWSTSGNNKKLTVSIPEDGLYSISVKNDPEINMDKSKLFIKGTNINLDKTAENFFGGTPISLQKGNYPVEFSVDPVNLLATDSSSLKLSSDFNEKLRIPVKISQDSGSKYEISFEYKIKKGTSPRVFVSDETNNQDLGISLNSNYSMDQRLVDYNDGEWHLFKQAFVSKQGSAEAYLNFWLSGQENGASSNVIINNLSVTKIVNPVIVFVKETGRKLSLPKITYQEINPTDYRIEIKNANSAFFLAFSEGFDNNWKLYMEKTQPTSATMAKNADIVASYFNGNVEEKRYEGSADMSAILGTFTEKSLPDYLHGQINGFGNGWLIPSGGLMPFGDYTIRVIYKPQRYVLIGTYVTIIAIIAVSIGILFLSINEIKKGNQKN